MDRIIEIKSLFDRLYNTNLTINDEIPGISIDDKMKLVKTVENARAEVERLHIIDIMNKVCK